MSGSFLSQGKTLAVFDFDHTLIEGESFWAFLGFVSGRARTAAALAEAMAQLALRRAKDKDDPEITDHRTFVKSKLLARLLAGQATTHLQIETQKLRRWMTWNAHVHKALLDHHEAGHHIVIASGGLDLYLPTLLTDLPHNGLICTRINIEDGIVKGEMLDGNCVRERKAELVRAYIEKHGPFDESWGYGNLPHDLPMLELMKHRIII